METIEKVVAELRKVKHPAINNSLINLGIVTDIDVEDNIVELVFAFPFPNIPIADQLVDSIAKPIKELGLEFKHSIRLMDEQEKVRFMQLEAEGWKGM